MLRSDIVLKCRFIACVIAGISMLFSLSSAGAVELPVLHLRKTSVAPSVLAKLQDPETASAWYPSSPTWFGCGGKTGDRNHTEVLVTYDDSALYVAFMNIDRSTVIYPKDTTTALDVVDSNAVWIQTPSGRRFYILAAIDNYYPPGSRKASGEFPAYDPKTNKLSGWTHSGWYAGDKTIQQTLRIPWSTLGTSAPAPGSRWRINFVNYNQTSDDLKASTVRRQTWAPGDSSQPDQWGYLAFDEAAYTPADVSPEATLTIRPATGFGEEITLRAGNAADMTNEWEHEAITQSNWNDWDPIDYTIKEYLQFDLSMIPKNRKIISARLQNHFRGHFESDPTDLYLHVIRLSGTYDPSTVTMLTSPLPVENGSRALVKASQVGSWVEFDVTVVVAKQFESGSTKVSMALAGSSGDINNGKIWNVSFGRADWYDKYRPRLVVTFGQPGVRYQAPVSIGSLNYTSVATTASKNKLTNGTFRYGTVEGHTNTTYWHADPGSLYIDEKNVALMRLEGDINPITGHPALRFMCPANWKWIRQYATGLVGGKTYTFSGWYKGSSEDIRADVRLEFQDADGNALGSGQAVYSGSGDWEQVKLTKKAPANTVRCKVELVNWTSGTGEYMLYSDLQLEEGSAPTAYSETMGVYYPDQPRTDGSIEHTGDNCIKINEELPIGSQIALTDKVVTGVFGGYFYIQCQDPTHKACGIKVVNTAAPSVGSLVDVTGILSRDSNDELVISSSTVALSSGVAAAAVPDALGRSNKNVGGGPDGNSKGPDGGAGLNTVGVLQVTWGRVTALEKNASMTIDDSSGPIKVLGPTGNAVVGSYVRVVGICGLLKENGIRHQVLRTRSAVDVQVIQENQ